jgi:hypothetical protein
MDGYDMDIVSGHSFDPTAAVLGDACRELFWVQINNPEAIFARGGSLAVSAGPVAPPTQANCARPFELLISRDTGNGFSLPEKLQGTGTFSCPSSCGCGGIPARIYTSTDVADGRPLRFGLAANDSTRRLFVGPTSADPR